MEDILPWHVISLWNLPIKKENLNMVDIKEENLPESLKGYKEKIITTNKATLKWDKDLVFLGRTQEGYEIEFDGHVQWESIW